MEPDSYLTEQRYRFLTDGLPQIVWTAAATGVTDFLNEYWFAYTGAPRESGIASFYQAVPHEDVARVIVEFRLAAEEKRSFELELRIRRGSDDALRWHLAKLKPILDEWNQITSWIGTALDIHDRKVAETDARSARRELSQILESITDAFIAVDRDWRLTYSSEKVARLAGISREDLIGRNVWEVTPGLSESLCHPQFRRVMEERIALDFDTPYPPDRWLAVCAYPTESGMIAWIVDKTEQKAAEEKLIQTSRMESLGILAGGVAHDFNNLLVGVLGAASLAQDMTAEPSPVKELLTVITDAAERASGLASQMLAFAGKPKTIRGRTDINALVRDLLELARSALGREIRVALELADNLPPALAGDGEIKPVVMNLVVNAAESIPAGASGLIILRTGCVHLSEALTASYLTIQPGRYVFLEVEDNGSGMTEDVCARIFDPFFTTKFTGRGLGLSAAHGTIRTHHGALHVDSKAGRGTRMRMYLPACQEKSGSHFAEGAKGRAILIIDDEPIVRSTCKAALEFHGFEVRIADSGAAGIQAFRESADRFSAVIVDHNMPDFSGFQVLEELSPAIHRTKVILSSGYPLEDLEGDLTSYPSATFLRKPYRMNQLIGLLG